MLEVILLYYLATSVYYIGLVQYLYICKHISHIENFESH